MTMRSLRSVLTIRSISSSDDISSEKTVLGYSDIFEELLPYICKQFDCPFNLTLFRKTLSAEPGSRKISPTKYKSLRTSTPSGKNVTKSETTAAAEKATITEDHFALTGSCFYNNHTVVELLFKNQKIPRQLIQALNLIASMFQELTKISIRNCTIDAYIVYELNKIVALEFLTDVCLDDSISPGGNYDLLLSEASSLRQLSLCRCSITDEVCQQIVSKLHYSAPAHNNLLILNLSGNRITDTGALYISEMLRTNKRLRFLNLAGNCIDDDGARHILNTLMEYPLIYDEIAEKRRKVLSYFKRKHQLVRKFMIEYENSAASSNRLMLRTQQNLRYDTSIRKDMYSSWTTLNLKSRRGNTANSNIKQRQNYKVKQKLRLTDDKQIKTQENAEKLAIHYLGQLEAPFNSNNCVVRKGWTYCTGNFTLSYLNLSYNNLTYISVKKVLDVLFYQSSNGAGIFKINIEGNLMPKTCPEYDNISSLLNKKLNVHIDRKKSREGRSKKK